MPWSLPPVGSPSPLPNTLDKLMLTLDAIGWWTIAAIVSALTAAFFAGEVRVLRVKLTLTAKDRDRWEAEARSREAELKVALDRLIASWKEGYTIPDAPPADETEDARPLMDQEAQTFLSQWEGAARAHWERFLIARRAAGRTGAQALADAEAVIVTGQENLLQPQLAPAVSY